MTSPNKAQKQFIESNIDKNILLLAPPGSGKTYAISRRYEYMANNGVKPENILVVTFSKTMADEMGHRIKKLTPNALLDQISTIHAFCYRMLCVWYPDSKYYKWRVPKAWQVKKELEKIINSTWHEKEKPSHKEVLNIIDNSKYHGLSVSESKRFFINHLGLSRGEWLYQIRYKFDLWMNKCRQIDFSGMLYFAEQLLSNDSKFRARLQARFSHIIIDEAQDTNYQAMRILRLLDAKMMAVGDTDQMLYRFQGANPDLLNGKLKEWLPDLEVMKLGTNYRSYDEIINFSQHLISNNYSDLGGPYNQEFAKDVAGVKSSGGNVEFEMYESPEDEAKEVSDTVGSLLQSDYKPSDFFIGARTKAQLGYLEGALVRAQIPFINITGTSFWNSKHVSDVIAYLRIALDSKDKDALTRINNIPSKWHTNKKGEYCPTRYLGKKFLAAINYNFDNAGSVYRAGKYGWQKRSYQSITDGQDDLIKFVGDVKRSIDDKAELNVGEVIKFIIDNCYEKHLKYEGVGDDGLANAKLDDLKTVIDVAKKYNDPAKFLSYVDEMAKIAQDTKDKKWDEYVVISTYHRLKGLERKVVFGLGWCEGVDIRTEEPRGLLPHSFSLTSPPDFSVLMEGVQSPIEDERCIAFVCISRAIERCYLSGVENYRTWQMYPSRFIKETGLLPEEDSVQTSPSS